MSVHFQEEIKNCGDWKNFLQIELSKAYFISLEKELIKDLEKKQVFPPKNNIFKAFELTPLSTVKVVILGQDPYHGINQANGLCFSVNHGVPFPPSLRNIFKEMMNDLKIALPSHGDLSNWAKQGVLLLNESLTVVEAQAASHQKLGWSKLTDAVIEKVSNEKSNTIFVLWGKHAAKKKSLIDEKKHKIIEAAHPSPLSAYRGFFDSQPFSQINRFLENTNQTTINWKLD